MKYISMLLPVALSGRIGSMGNRVWIVPDPTNNFIRASECPRQKSGSYNRCVPVTLIYRRNHEIILLKLLILKN